MLLVVLMMQRWHIEEEGEDDDQDHDDDDGDDDNDDDNDDDDDDDGDDGGGISNILFTATCLRARCGSDKLCRSPQHKHRCLRSKTSGTNFKTAAKCFSFHPNCELPDPTLNEPKSAPNAQARNGGGLPPAPHKRRPRSFRWSVCYYFHRVTNLGHHHNCRCFLLT